MATVKHLGLFPPARFIDTSGDTPKRVEQPCLEPIEIEFANTIEYPRRNLYVLPETIDGVIKSPFRVNLKEAMDFYWRVKTWDLRWIKSWTEDLGDTPIPPEFDWKEDVGVIDSEKELVCGQSFLTIPDDIEADEYFPFVNCRIFGNWNISTIQNRPILVNNMGEYFLNIRTSGFIEDLWLITRITKIAPLSWRLEGEVYFDTQIGGTVMRGELAGTTIFEISPLEWWPYDPDDGNGPIYNINTGARIRNDV